MKIFFFVLVAVVTPLIQTSQIEEKARRRTKRDEEISKEIIKGYHDEFFTEFLVTNDQCVKESEMLKYRDYKTKQCVFCTENTNGIGSSFLCGKHYTNTELKKERFRWEKLLIETANCWDDSSYDKFYDYESKKCKSCEEKQKGIYDYFCNEYHWKQEITTITTTITVFLILSIIFVITLLAVGYYFYDRKQNQIKKDPKKGGKNESGTAAETASLVENDASPSNEKDSKKDGKNESGTEAVTTKMEPGHTGK